MSGLILKLRPHEQLMINGVVVENGDRKTRLRVKTLGAHILRLRDAMKPEDATTPLKRAYYVAQMAVAGQLPNSEAAALLAHALEDYGGGDADSARDAIAARIAENDFYQAMRYLAEIMARDANAGNDDAPPDDETFQEPQAAPANVG